MSLRVPPILHLPVRRARRAEVRRRHDGLNVPVQDIGEGVANCTMNSVVRLDVLVELVRSAEDIVGLRHGHADDL